MEQRGGPYCSKLEKMQLWQGVAVDDEHDVGEGGLVVASWRKCSLSKVTLLMMSMMLEKATLLLQAGGNAA
jgi:hypothetical protein